MRKNSIKNTRVNAEVHKELAEIIRNGIKDPRIQPMTCLLYTSNLGKADAILTENEQVKTEVFRPTERIKLYILEVKDTPKGPKILVSRTHPEPVSYTHLDVYKRQYIFSCMNTDKICVFTDSGRMHTIKVLDLPFGKFRDKGTPIDNVSNFDSSAEQMVFVSSLSGIKDSMLFFATKTGMLKQVDRKSVV